MGPFGHWYWLLLILVLVLIVWGPGKLPEVGGAIGRAMREFRKASSDLQDEIRKGTAEPTPPAPVERPTTDVTKPSETKS